MKYDPRAIKLFSQLDLAAPVLSGLPKTPTGMQSKLLAANLSGLDVFARSSPGSGKSTAAAAAIAQSRGILSSLVLVPTPTLAAQYGQMLEKMGTQPRMLFRTGDVAADQLQHTQKNSNVLVATPQRVLDYLTYDPKLLPLKLDQVIVDELELFQTSANRPTALEQLLEHIVSTQSPGLTLIANTRRKLRFHTLEQTLLLQAQKRRLVQVAENLNLPQTQITVLRCTGEEIDVASRHLFPHSSGTQSGTKPLLKLVDKVWDKQALILVPDSTSPQIEHPATMVKYSDISGVNMGLHNLLVMGWQPEWDLTKLAYQATQGPEAPRITICLTSDDNSVLENIYSQLDELASGGSR